MMPLRETPLQLPCEGNYDVWFSLEPRHQIQALAGCRTCPIQQACREDVEARGGEVHGVFGGHLYGGTRQKPLVPPVERICAWCQSPFITKQGSNAKYCSKECGQAGYAASQVTCERHGCSKRFVPKMKTQKYCSPACNRKVQNSRYVERARERERMIKGHPRLAQLVDAAS